MPDVNVIYTRKSDVFIPLHQRADIANKAKADLFVSVHTNSVASGRYVKGFQVYTLGMHRAKDNLDVAKRENSVISMEKGYQQTYQASTLTRQRAILCSSSCRMRTWKGVLNWQE